MQKKIFTITTICFLLLTIPLMSFAHSGRTDSNGGHRDNKNKSGLGYYHYHCGGYPPHLHTNGVCPYKKKSSSPQKKASTQTKTASSTITEKKEVLAKDIIIKNKPDKIKVYEEIWLDVIFLPENTTNKDVKWISSNENVASVTNGGKLIGVSSGKATITVIHNDIKDSFEITVYSYTPLIASGVGGVGVLSASIAAILLKRKKKS